MHEGKFVFSQLMEFVPWRRFQTCVNHDGGDYKVSSYKCVEQFRVMAFAQLTYRHSLREVEACLRVAKATNDLLSADNYECRLLPMLCQDKIRRHSEEQNANPLVQNFTHRSVLSENTRQLRCEDRHQKAPQGSRCQERKAQDDERDRSVGVVCVHELRQERQKENGNLRVQEIREESLIIDCDRSALLCDLALCNRRLGGDGPYSKVRQVESTRVFDDGKCV